jgi:repressor of nif and glnA expression
MTSSDDRILELLADTDAAHDRRGIEVNIELRGDTISYTTVQRRIPMLADVGLIEAVDEAENYYVITGRGRKYLSGELDVSKIERK